MTAEIVSYMMADKDKNVRMQFELVSQCAPFLKGMKTASILNVDRECVRGIYRMIKNTDISCRILIVRRGKCLAMFYREEELLKLLSDGNVREFLWEYGYKEEGLGRVLTLLSRRMNRYFRGEIPFPHEIGVFLDYPLGDVKAFIKYNGQGSVLSGYWKVYHNPKQAGFKFHTFDKAADWAVNEFLSGKSLREIIRNGI